MNPGIAKVLIVSLNKDQVDKQIPIGFINYKGKFKHFNSAKFDKNDTLDYQFLLSGKLKFGQWDEYTYVHDYNKNGKDEILIFQALGMGVFPYIFEYHDEKMKMVLKSPTDRGPKKMHTGVEDGKKMIYIQYYKEMDDKRKGYPYYKYRWNKKTKMYEIYEQGRDK
jgi:hypothetical protein